MEKLKKFNKVKDDASDTEEKQRYKLVLTVLIVTVTSSLLG